MTSQNRSSQAYRLADAPLPPLRFERCYSYFKQAHPRLFVHPPNMRRAWPVFQPGSLPQSNRLTTAPPKGDGFLSKSDQEGRPLDPPSLRRWVGGVRAAVHGRRRGGLGSAATQRCSMQFMAISSQPSIFSLSGLGPSLDLENKLPRRRCASIFARSPGLLVQPSASLLESDPPPASKVGLPDVARSFPRRLQPQLYKLKKGVRSARVVCFSPCLNGGDQLSRHSRGHVGILARAGR